MLMFNEPMVDDWLRNYVTAVGLQWYRKVDVETWLPIEAIERIER